MQVIAGATLTMRRMLEYAANPVEQRRLCVAPMMDWTQGTWNQSLVCAWYTPGARFFARIGLKVVTNRSE
jgi:hypothetical protein